jgi:23S rRNA pseudouridine1911/1915/1917 synthase
VRTVFEDRWLLVVDKPAGLPSQPARDRRGPDLHGLLAEAHPYVGLHHRLDTGASGLVLFTLDPSVNAAIARAFRDHLVERGYVAVLDGDPVPGPWTRALDGKSAHTDVDVVGIGDRGCAVRCRLATGRTHQIRRHAALAGAPIVGDRRYGGRPWERLALHAETLALVHPVTGERLALCSPPPPPLDALWRSSGGAD